MKKEKFHIEYVFNKVSNHSLWNHLTTPAGLSAWFADHVDITGNLCTFTWNKSPEYAKIFAIRPEISVKFRWITEEEDSKEYFGFMIHHVEITGSTALEIIDFATTEEKTHSIAVWDSQIETLKRTLGI
jgi:hypothetical protein